MKRFGRAASWICSVCMIGGALAAASQVPPAASAQPSPATQAADNPPVTTLKAETRAVLLDVVVTKGNGEPVAGLTKDDFAVAEDGQPQTVLSFEEHHTQGVKFVPLPKMPPNVFTNVPAAPLAQALTVILLDGLNTPMQDQSYVREEILRYLKTVPDDTPLALFTLGDKLRMITGFNQSRADLIAAMEDKKNAVDPQTSHLSHSPSDEREDQEHIKTLQMMLGGFGRSSAGVAAAQFAQGEMASYGAELRTEMTVEALQNLARYLAKIPGRKNLIWFASSFPLQFFPSMNAKGMYDLGVLNNGMKEVADLLAVSRVAIYPISADGLDTRTWMEGDSTGPGGRASAGAGLMSDIRREDAESAANIASMNELASETGGEMIHNTNDFVTAVNHAVDNGTHYYTLSYSPTNTKMNGELRSVQIKLRRGKYKLSYRRGYYAFDETTPRPKAATAAVAQAALAVTRGEDTAAALRTAPSALLPLLQHGSPSSTQILYGLRIAPAQNQPAPGGKFAGGNAKLTGSLTRYTLDFLIRWTDVHFDTAASGTHEGELGLQVIAYDKDGQALNWNGSTMKMHLTPELLQSIQRSGVPAHLEVDMPERAESFATGVYDFLSGKAGTLEIERTSLFQGGDK